MIQFATRHPLPVLFAWLVALFALSPGLRLLTVDTSTDSVLDRSGPEWAFYESSQALFGGDEIIVVALESDEPLGRESLELHAQLSGELESIDGVARVDSLTTLPVIEADESGDLRLDPAIAGPGVRVEGLERLRHVSAFDRIIPETLVSADGRMTAISIVLERGADEHQERILGEINDVTEGIDVRISGVPVFRVEANRTTRTEISRFAKLTAAILALFLLVTFRSPMAVVYGLASGVLGTVVVLETMGFLGVPISIATMILPSMLIALGSAYSMHIIVAVGGVVGGEAIRRALKPLALPIALSGATTAIGLLSLGMVQIDAVVHVGIYGAVGVIVVTAITLSAVPAGLTLAPIRVEREFGVRWPYMAMVSAICRHSTALLAVWVAVGLVFAVGVWAMKVETDATNWFEDGHVVRDDYLEIREKLSGISPVNVVIDTGIDGNVLDPQVLERVDALSDFLERQPEVGKAISIADPLRQLHGGFVGDESAPLPTSRALSEQYMLLIEGVSMIGDLIDEQRRYANILLRVDDNGSGDILDLARRTTEWWDEHGVAAASVQATGIMYEFARAEDQIAYGQLSGLAFAVLSISGVLLLMLRRIKLALIALIPNALPLVLIFGFMGLSDIPVDAGTVLIGALALGVAVDDTIHLMTTFVSAIESGVSSQIALAQAFRAALPAIVLSTIMISIGFGVFVGSDFTLTRNLGWLTSSVMVVCLLADVLLLGALVVVLDLSE